MSNLCNDLIGLFSDFGPTQGTLQCRMLKWYLQCSSDFQNYFVGHVSLFWHAEYPHASAPAIHLKIIDLLFGSSIFLLKWGNLCLKSFSHCTLVKALDRRCYALVIKINIKRTSVLEAHGKGWVGRTADIAEETSSEGNVEEIPWQVKQA